MLPNHVVVPQLVRGVSTAGKDCGPAGGAQIVSFVTYGQVEPDARDVRRFIHPPDFGPTNVGQISMALLAGFGVSVRVASPDPFETLWEWIKDPRNIATVYIQYSVFHGTPLNASLTGFGGSHTITVSNAASDDTCLEGDPLADGRPGVPKGPLRITKTLLRRACGYVFVVRNGTRQRLGVGKVIVGYARAPEPEPDEPEVKSDAMDNLFPDTYLAYVVDLPVGTVLYEDAALTVRQSKVSTPDAGGTTKAFALIGAPIASGSIFRVANGDRGVFIKRGTLKPRRAANLVRVGA